VDQCGHIPLVLLLIHSELTYQMALLTVEDIKVDIQNMDVILTENEKDRKGNVKLDKKGNARPNAITSGLNEWQIAKLKETVSNLRTVDGAYKFYAAKELYDLRGMIRGSKKGENPKQWTAFKKSGLVPFSAREIQDLCGSYEWLRDSGLEGPMLNTVGIRTMALIASCPNKGIQAKLTAALMSGEQVTRNRASLMINPPTVEKAKPTYEAKLVAIKSKLTKWNTSKIRDEYQSLFEKNFELEEQVKALKAKLNA